MKKINFLWIFSKRILDPFFFISRAADSDSPFSIDHQAPRCLLERTAICSIIDKKRMGFRHIFCLQSHAFSESLLQSVFSAEHFHDSLDFSPKKATSYLAVINPLSSIAVSGDISLIYARIRSFSAPSAFVTRQFSCFAGINCRDSSPSVPNTASTRQVSRLFELKR